MGDVRDLDALLAAYEKSHRNRTNVAIHKICVPAIVLSIVGLLYVLPEPSIGPPVLMWVAFGVALYYAHLRPRFAVVFICEFLVAYGLLRVLDIAGLPLAPTALSVFVLAWIGQFVGHKIEGARPSFLDDLLFLLIGPLWTNLQFFPSLGAGLKYDRHDERVEQA